MKTHTPPSYHRRTIFYFLRTILLILALVGVIIGVFGVPYLRVKHDRIYMTYSNGLDDFKRVGDFGSLIVFVPVRERLPAWRDALLEAICPCDHDH